jgi:hypothetical protein
VGGIQPATGPVPIPAFQLLWAKMTWTRGLLLVTPGKFTSKFPNLFVHKNPRPRKSAEVHKLTILIYRFVKLTKTINTYLRGT